MSDNRVHHLSPADPKWNNRLPDYDLIVTLFKQNGALSNASWDDPVSDEENAPTGREALLLYIKRRFCSRPVVEDVEALNNLIQLLDTVESSVAS